MSVEQVIERAQERYYAWVENPPVEHEEVKRKRELREERERAEAELAIDKRLRLQLAELTEIVEGFEKITDDPLCEELVLKGEIVRGVVTDNLAQLKRRRHAKRRAIDEGFYAKQDVECEEEAIKWFDEEIERLEKRQQDTRGYADFLLAHRDGILANCETLKMLASGQLPTLSERVDRINKNAVDMSLACDTLSHYLSDLAFSLPFPGRLKQQAADNALEQVLAWNLKIYDIWVELREDIYAERRERREAKKQPSLPMY